ncbi:hypothetical protein Lnau_2891 [Legionella nautarum]|uniref:Uncharacterized protein n=1 Tax=Legionella nautarum TaxID=45070 RepID=A0A0W0WLN0_9GAMM|nr:hypothetical protein [Legionella nautarum]KTD33243.1 hypothetical protein Lnau_2891 [Legionella nautarum]
MSKKIKRSNEATEIKNGIRDQLTYIKNSCKLFDSGYKEEAIRIGGAINVLLENRPRSNSQGLLRRITSPIQLLSSISSKQNINTERLLVLKNKNISEVKHKIELLKEDIKLKKQFLLSFILDSNEWYFFAFDNEHNEISCLLSNLINHLNLKRGGKLLIGNWVNLYTNDDKTIQPIGKRIVIQHLNALLNHDAEYITGLYFPMIDSIFDPKAPILSNSETRFVDISCWLDEIIFSIMDDTREYHLLTRKELIDSARDQDGGGHYDLQLDIMGYYKSKYGEKIMEENGKDITTANFHLIMLRQLGYEILNSPSINEAL